MRSWRAITAAPVLLAPEEEREELPASDAIRYSFVRYSLNDQGVMPGDTTKYQFHELTLVCIAAMSIKTHAGRYYCMVTLYILSSKSNCILAVPDLQALKIRLSLRTASIPSHPL